MKGGHQPTNDRKKEFPIWVTVVVVFTCGVAANFLGDVIFVCLVYGPDAFFKQGVYIAKHKPYTLSTGAVLSDNLSTIGWALNGIIWIGLVIVTMLILTRLLERLRPRKPANNFS